MSVIYKNIHNATFDTANAFLECRAREAGRQNFEFDKAYTYLNTEVVSEGKTIECVYFEHKASRRSIGVTVEDGEVTKVLVYDTNGDCLNVKLSSADKIRNNPKDFFKQTLTPKKYSASASSNFTIDVECEAYDEDEAREKLEEAAYNTYLTADHDGVDATIEDINEDGDAE
jgi:hypothetical protein